MMPPKSKLRLALRSARVSLWPAIFLNAGIITYSITASFRDGLLLALSLSCIASFGFLINDCRDVLVDRANGSKRLENAGKKELGFVRLISVGFLVAALGLATILGVQGLVTIGLIGFGLVVYTFYARQKLLFATALAAILSSTPLWAPGVIFNSVPGIFQIGVIIVSLILLVGREIIFDAEDFRGDSYGARRTFATVFDPKFALKLSGALNTLGSLLLVVLVVGSNWNKPLTLINSWPSFLGVCLFLWLLLPPIFKLKHGDESSQSFRIFTQRSRVAMLLLPVFWLSF